MTPANGEQQEMLKPEGIVHLLSWMAFCVAVVVALVIAISCVIVRPYGWVLPISDTSQPLPMPERQPGTCRLTGVAAPLLELDCGGARVFAMPAGIRSFAELPARTAQDALAAGITTYLNASGLEDAPRCSLHPGLPPLRDAVCGSAEADLALFLVAGGWAIPQDHDGSRPSVLSRPHADRLAAAHEQARDARSGLHADLILQRNAERSAVQSWLATAIGLTVAVSGFLIGGSQARRRWERLSRQSRGALRAKLQDCTQCYAAWISDGGQGSTPSFLAALDGLRDGVAALAGETESRRNLLDGKIKRLSNQLKAFEEEQKGDPSTPQDGISVVWNELRRELLAIADKEG